MQQILRVLLAATIFIAPCLAYADTDAPFSKPFHKQGRGWYPSMYWSTGRNLGSFYFPNTNGKVFKELGDYEWDKEQSGLLYVYRPNSQWATEELEAPSYYVNDELIFNLRAGSYTVIELPVGSYDFAARKSFLPLIGFEAFDDKLMIAFDLNLLIDVGLEIDPGSITYVRHSEVSLPERLHPDIAPDNEMASADVQLVDRELALKEMSKTRYLTHSFWHSNDSPNTEALLSGEMQDYGWFTVIWPWSNNFLFGFPLFYLPSDMYHELVGKDRQLTLEQELYLLADDREEYLAAIESYRRPKRNWLAPWRRPKSHLTLNDELLLERLEGAALAGNIAPALVEGLKVKQETEDDGTPWYWPFRTQGGEPEQFLVTRRSKSEARISEIERIKGTLN